LSQLNENSQYYDFHSHSYFSDGELSPTALVQHAAANQVQLLALTDHDTVAGVAEAQDAATQAGLKLVTGVELSALWEGREIHVVGLDFDPEASALVLHLQRQQARRRVRGQEMAAAFSRLGIRDTYTEVCKLARYDNITRPHFAQVLVQRGVVSTMQKAFDRFLKSGKPAYVAAKWPTIEKTVSAIQAAGGLAVLAHPLRYRLTPGKLRALLTVFKTAQGDAVEVVTATHAKAEQARMSQLAVEYGFLASQGSDFHSHAAYANIGHLSLMPSHCAPIWSRFKL
jgi:3',5'-nucleoside bisphosphate phosphatase